MTDKSIAILGLGRSGVSVAKAAVKAGAKPKVFDERPIDSVAKHAAAEEMRMLGVPVEAGWDGAFLDTGCDLVVTSPGVPMRSPRLLRAVEEGLEIISEVEFAYRISKAPIVAITGTNGKSTTTAMTWLCLKAAGVDAVLCGNIYGSGYPEIPLTDAASESKPEQVLVAEISSFQLEFIKEFRPIAATITTLTPDHLNRYKDFEEYAAMKRRVFRNMREGCTAVWNLDDPTTKPTYEHDHGELRYGVSTTDSHETSGKTVNAWETSDALVILGDVVLKKDLPFTEPHNYRNAMCAALLAIAASQGRATVKGGLLQGLSEFHGLSHRMERLGEKAGIAVINNSMCTNPGALIASSQSVSGRQRLIVGGENKQLDFEPVRVYLENSPHTLYLFGRDGTAINDQLGVRWRVFETMADAFRAAAADAVEGDTIMLAPAVASTDQFKDFRDRGEQFRKLVQDWMGSLPQ